MLIKDYYNIDFIKQIASKIKNTYPQFDNESLIADMQEKLQDQTYSEKMIIIANGLNKYLPDYKRTLEIFTAILGEKLNSMKEMYDNMEYAPFGKYIEIYAPQNKTSLEESLNYVYELTQRYTGEFAMRPLLSAFPTECIKKIKEWTDDKSDCVRRLCSECMRIAIPWGSKIDFALRYFEDYCDILLKLSTDGCEYVRRSVANNLNELCKANLEKGKVLIEMLNRIDNKNIKKIITHGTRYVRKKGIL